MAKYLKGLVCSCSSDMLQILAEQELQFINQNWSKISFCAAKFQKLVMESTTRFIDSHPPPLPHTHTNRLSRIKNIQFILPKRPVGQKSLNISVITKYVESETPLNYKNIQFTFPP